MIRIKLLSSIWLFFISQQLLPQTSLFDQQMRVDFDEKQGQYVDLDIKLTDENGNMVLLRDVIKKPTILNLVYFNCPGTCSPLMFGLSRSIDAVDLELGVDYQVLTISFDPREGIVLGREKKANYILTMTKKEEAMKNWSFFVTDSANIDRLTKSVGFNYTMFNNQYIHPTGLIILGSDGKIIRYMRGIEFLPFEVKITLVEAADGKIGPSINRLLAVCYSYDEKGNQFVFNVTKVSAIIIIFILALVFIFLAIPRNKPKPKVD